MDDLVVPTPGRVAEDSFRAAAPDGVPVRDVELEEAAVAAFGLSGLVGDLKAKKGQHLLSSRLIICHIPVQCSRAGT